MCTCMRACGYICIYPHTHVDVWNAKIRGHAATMVEGSLRI